MSAPASTISGGYRRFEPAPGLRPTKCQISGAASLVLRPHSRIRRRGGRLYYRNRSKAYTLSIFGESTNQAFTRKAIRRAVRHGRCCAALQRKEPALSLYLPAGARRSKGETWAARIRRIGFHG